MGSAVDKTSFARLVNELAREVNEVKEAAEVLNIAIKRVSESLELLGKLAEKFEEARQSQTHGSEEEDSGEESDNSTLPGSLSQGLSESDEDLELVSGISEENSDQEELVVD